MRIYLDVSCLNRPFDDQSQPRIRLESEAVLTILQEMQRGFWTQISSEMADIEIQANPDGERRAQVALLLPDKNAKVKLTTGIWTRADELQRLGFKPADAVHIAAAEAGRAGVFLSCDDRLCRCAKRNKRQLKVDVANPLEWLKEVGNGNDA
jgi:predicted nucleic acid-binding protein